METLFKDFIIRCIQFQDTDISIATNKMMLTCVKMITLLTDLFANNFAYLIYIRYIRYHKIKINKIVQLHKYLCT